MLNFVFNFQSYNDSPLNLTGNPKICRTIMFVYPYSDTNSTLLKYNFGYFTNEVAADLLSTGRQSGNQWIQGILFYAESYSRKIGGLLMRKTLRRTRGWFSRQSASMFVKVDCKDF